MNKCGFCGGDMISIREVKIPSEPYEDEEQDFYDGYEGKCKDCRKEDVWYA